MCELCVFQGMPGAEYWIPNQLRPRLPLPGMPRFFPRQPFYPPDMAAGYFLPPRFPPGYVPFRQRLPIYNSRQPRPQIKSITNEESSTTAAGTENKDATSKTSDGTAEQQTEEKTDKGSGNNDKEKDESDKSDNDSRS